MKNKKSKNSDKCAKQLSKIISQLFNNHRQNIEKINKFVKENFYDKLNGWKNSQINTTI